ncbi:hypothetical protein AAG906_018514 [Vitis piasezkii]
MGNGEYKYPATGVECAHRVAVPPLQPFTKTLKTSLKETFFPDDPLRQFKNQPASRKFILGLQYLFPILEWGPRYSLQFLKADLISGICIASLAIPHGIANQPQFSGYVNSSFVPPLVYAMMGSSRDLAVGTVGVGSLLMASMLGNEVKANEHSQTYLHLAFLATFFAGVFKLRLGLWSISVACNHSGVHGRAATVVCLQQLKGILGLNHFTHGTDIVSAMRSVFTQTHQWRWESGVLGCCFLFFLMLTKYFQEKPKFFWVSAMAPLTSVILGSLLVYLTGAERDGVQVVHRKLEERSQSILLSELPFGSPYLSTAIKTGIVTGIIAAANYPIDGNKEMIAFGMMNIAGSCTSCCLTTGLFSRSEVNFNAGCKTAMSNIVMAMAVMITLLFLTPLLHYTPIVVLSSISIAPMLGLIDYDAAIHLWKVDKFDFIVCMTAYIGVGFGSVEIGLVLPVAISLLRMLLFVARPRTSVSVDQYPAASTVPGFLILEIDAPFASPMISRWIDEEENKLEAAGESSLQYVILAMGAVGNIDTSGISMLEEVKKSMERRGSSGEAVGACNFMLHTCKPKAMADDSSMV